MANSADPDQLASEEANWSGSTLFAKAGHIRVQQDKSASIFLGNLNVQTLEWRHWTDCAQIFLQLGHLFVLEFNSQVNTI